MTRTFSRRLAKLCIGLVALMGPVAAVWPATPRVDDDRLLRSVEPPAKGLFHAQPRDERTRKALQAYYDSILDWGRVLRPTFSERAAAIPTGVTMATATIRRTRFARCATPCASTPSWPRSSPPENRLDEARTRSVPRGGHRRDSLSRAGPSDGRRRVPQRPAVGQPVAVGHVGPVAGHGRVAAVGEARSAGPGWRLPESSNSRPTGSFANRPRAA